MCHLCFGVLCRKPKPRLRQLRARTHDGLLIVERVEREKRIPGIEEPTFCERWGDPCHSAGNLWDQLRFGSGSNRSLTDDRHLLFVEGDLVDADTRWSNYRGLGFDVGPTADHGGGCQHRDSYDDQRQQDAKYSNQHSAHSSSCAFSSTTGVRVVAFGPVSGF